MNKMESDTSDKTQPDLIYRHSVCVDDLPASRRFEEWRDSVSCIFRTDTDSDTRHSDFRGRVDAYFMNSSILYEVETLRQEWKRSPLDIANDGMDHYIVQYFLSGSMQCELRGVDQSVEAGGIGVYDLSYPLKMETSTVRTISFIIPRHQLEPLLHTPDLGPIRIIPPTMPLAQLVGNHLVSLRNIAPNVTFDQAGAITPQTIGLIAACINESSEAVGNGHIDKHRNPLVIAKSYIEQNIGDPNLSPLSIARHTGVSRTRLYELFEPVGGVAHFIRTKRLRRVLRILKNPDFSNSPVYNIALENGFENASSFSRLFKSQFGFSPSDLRNKEQVREQIANLNAFNQVGMIYSDWLQRI